MKLIKIILTFILKILKSIRLQVKEIFYPEINNYIFQEKIFQDFGFLGQREEYIFYLNKFLKNLGFPFYSEKKGMYSEHLVIFSAISKEKIYPKNILEIGTFDGKTSVILANLFPKSKIITIDLSDNDPIFKSIYNRKNSLKKFIKKRNKLISSYKNITFLQGNSLFLSLSKSIEKQDLIWVDGAHGYPIVCSDITNCISLLNENGILMCDDIFKKYNNNDPIYKSSAGYETLDAFNKAEILKTDYFLKRLSKEFNLQPKFIAVSKLFSNIDNKF